MLGPLDFCFRDKGDRSRPTFQPRAEPEVRASFRLRPPTHTTTGRGGVRSWARDLSSTSPFSPRTACPQQTSPSEDEKGRLPTDQSRLQLILLHVFPDVSSSFSHGPPADSTLESFGLDDLRRFLHLELTRFRTLPEKPERVDSRFKRSGRRRSMCQDAGQAEATSHSSRDSPLDLLSVWPLQLGHRRVYPYFAHRIELEDPFQLGPG